MSVGMIATRSDFYWVREIASRLGVSSQTVYRWITEGKVPPPIKIGSTMRFPREAIDEWFANGCPPQDKNSD
jgi:excisionase family DNA binding protein